MADAVQKSHDRLRHAYQSGPGVTVPAVTGYRVIVHGLRVGLNDTDVTNGNIVVRSGAVGSGQLLDQVTLDTRHSVTMGTFEKGSEVYVTNLGEGLALEDSAGTLIAKIAYSYTAGGLDVPDPT